MSDSLTDFLPRMRAAIVGARSPVTLSVYRRRGDNEEPLFSAGLTGAWAREQLANTDAPEAASWAAQLGQETGPLGMISAQAAAVVSEAAHLALLRVVNAHTGPLRVRLRGTETNVNATIQSLGTDTTGLVPARAEDSLQGHVDALAAVSRHTIASSHAVIESGRNATDAQDARWGKLFDRSDKVQDKLCEGYERLLQQKDAQIAAQGERITTLEKQVKDIADAAQKAVLEDRTISAATTVELEQWKQLGSGARELFSYGFTAYQLHELNKRGVGPESLPAVKLLLEHPDLVRLLTRPDVQAALSDGALLALFTRPDVQAAIFDPAVLRVLTSPDFREMCADETQIAAFLRIMRESASVQPDEAA
ncbi:hypothetical protein L6R46_04350 [Myxococcota bacterium]|nr:hypothetical protein [Myxococcota bacterium]